MPRRPSQHVDSAEAVGERLRRARAAAGLTQRQLAFEGCTPAYISRVEAGARIPSLQILSELGRRLGVSAEYLARGRSEEAAEDPLFDAELAARLGDREAARATYRRLIEAGGPRTVVARAHAGSGFIAFEEGEHHEAIAHFEEALEGVPAGAETAMVADRLGRAYALSGRFDEALALFKRYLAEAGERGDAIDRIRFSVLLANTEIDRCDFAAAEQLLSDVLDEARSSADPATRASLYWAQSRLHSSQNEPQAASRYARLALTTLEQTEHTGYVGNALLLLAVLANDQGNHREALDLVTEAAPAIQAAGNRYDRGRLELEQARAEVGLGRREEAASRVLGSLPLLADSSPTNAGRGYALAAGIFHRLGDPAKAIELYELAVESFPANDRHAADAYGELAELAEETGDKDAALRYLKLALNTRSGVHADGPR